MMDWAFEAMLSASYLCAATACAGIAISKRYEAAERVSARPHATRRSTAAPAPESAPARAPAMQAPPPPEPTTPTTPAAQASATQVTKVATNPSGKKQAARHLHPRARQSPARPVPEPPS